MARRIGRIRQLGIPGEIEGTIAEVRDIPLEAQDQHLLPVPPDHLRPTGGNRGIRDQVGKQEDAVVVSHIDVGRPGMPGSYVAGPRGDCRRDPARLLDMAVVRNATDRVVVRSPAANVAVSRPSPASIEPLSATATATVRADPVSPVRVSLNTAGAASVTSRDTAAIATSAGSVAVAVGVPDTGSSGPCPSVEVTPFLVDLPPSVLSGVDVDSVWAPVFALVSARTGFSDASLTSPAPSPHEATSKPPTTSAVRTASATSFAGPGDLHPERSVAIELPRRASRGLDESPLPQPRVDKRVVGRMAP